MSKRTYWTKLNHDDARLAIGMMDDAEIGRWFRGWLAGAGGNEYHPDRVSAWPIEMRTGFASGRESFADAERYSEKQRDRVSKRYHGSTTVYHGTTTDPTTIPTGSLPTNNQQPTTNSEHPETKKERRAKFIPPTPEEAMAYAKEIGFTRWETWMDHYTANGWMAGKVKMVDWRACMAKWNREGFVQTNQKPRKNGAQFNDFAKTDYKSGLDEFTFPEQSRG
jgi:hypothetical protein